MACLPPFSRDLATEGGREGASGGRDQTSLGLNQQEAGDGSGVGGPTANIRGLYKGDGIQRRVEVVQEVVASDGCVTEAEDYAKRDLVSSV